MVNSRSGLSISAAFLQMTFLVLLATGSQGFILGQLFCDHCWDGQYSQGVDTRIANAQVTVNCTVTVSGGKTVYYWGSDSTDIDGNFQASITGTSDKLGVLSAEASFLKGLFIGSSFLLGQISGTKVVGCKISVTGATSCPILSYNDGIFLTTGVEGNGWTSSQVSLHQSSLLGLVDIYIGSSGSHSNSISCAPPVRGQGTTKQCPTTATPPPPPAGSKGDPHFTGGDNSHYDFTGEPGNHYCLISDGHLHINALYGGRYDRWGNNPRKALTWMRSIAVLWGNHTVAFHAREGARWLYDNGYMASIQVDGQPVRLNEAGDCEYLLDGAVVISWLAAKWQSGDDLVDVYSLKIGDVLIMRMTLRPEVPNLRTQEDGVVHFDIEFPQVQLSDSAHGVLGQTFRPGHRFRLEKQKVKYDALLKTEVVPGDNAEGFLDGDAEDYISSALLAADCEFGRFTGRFGRPQSTSAGGVQLTSASASSVIASGNSRKMFLGMKV